MRSPKVLIIEDESRQRTVMKKWLTKDGYECIEAANGFEGLARLADNHGDVKLVILDLLMPEMDGYEFLDVVRNEKSINTPVIICTGVSTEYVSNLNLDVFSIFEKPVNHDVFMSKVESAFYFGNNRTSIIDKMKRLSTAIEGVNQYAMA